MKKKHIIISKIENDNQHLEVLGDISTINKLESSFKILANENVKWMKSVKERRWDGLISFFKNNIIALGLLSELLNICNSKGITYQIKFNYKNKISYDKFKKWVATLNIPFGPRDYQYKIAYDLINKKRVSAQSETSSGKSLSMYILTRFMLMKKMQIIIIVPNIDLVYQMYNDFMIDYKWSDTSKYVQRIGDKFKDKRFLKPVIITTWQSLNAKRVKFYKQLNKKNSTDINKMKLVNKQINMLLKKNEIKKIEKLFKKYRKYYEDYESLHLRIFNFEKEIRNDFSKVRCIIGDEVDTLSSELITGLFSLCTKADYRLGLTGTMPDKKYSNWYNISTNFGEVIVYNTYKSLQKDGNISDFTVNTKILQYPKTERIKFYENSRRDYITQQEEIAKLDSKKHYLMELLNSIEGNSLVLFSLKDKEGKHYKDFFKDNNKLKSKFYYIDGDVKNRTDIIIELKNSKEKWCLFATKQTVARGINIPSLRNAILTTTFKSPATLVQFIGRIARLYKGENTNSVIIDIVDNMVAEISGLKVNFSVSHYQERLETYKKKEIEVIEEEVSMRKYYPKTTIF